MKLIRKSLIYSTLFLIMSCNTSIDYKYSNEKDVLVCPLDNKKLIKEAVYAFENYLQQNYFYKDLNDKEIVYSNYWSTIDSKMPPKTDKLDEHTKNILAKFSDIEDLFVNVNGKIVLNQKSDVVSCIASEIQDQDLKTTYNALLKSNALKAELFVPAIRRNTSMIANDKALATYVALEQFYAELLNLDLSLTDRERYEMTVNSAHNH